MSDSIFKQLNRQLTQVGNRTKWFGGFSIIFAGDFRQLEPICSKESELFFQENQVEIGMAISMPSLFLITNNASKKMQNTAKC
jgi:hypothetical protein